MADYAPSAQAVAAAALLTDYLSRFPVAVYGGPRTMGQGALPFQATCDAVLAVAPIPLSVWSVGTTYPLGVGVVYGTTIYVSLAAGNLGNQPDISPAWWFPLLNTGIPGKWPIVSTAADVPAAVISTHYEVDATAGLRSIVLPAVGANIGDAITVAKVDATANVVRVSTAAGTINGVATKDIAFQHTCLTFRDTGTLWRIIA